MVSELQESDKFELNFDEYYILVNNNELNLTLDNDQKFIDA